MTETKEICEHKEEAFLFIEHPEFSKCEMRACLECGEITEECELYNCKRGEY